MINNTGSKPSKNFTVLELECEYKLYSGKKPYRNMTFEEVLALPIKEIKCIGLSGKAVSVNVNGSVKRIKDKPGHLRLPCKYGANEYGFIIFNNYVQETGLVAVAAL
jgi:hypothetical protein